MEDPREAGRLVAKVDATAWVDRYLLDVLATQKQASIPFGGAVLEVGCGTGIIIAEVSKNRPDLTCVGVDSSLRRLTDGHQWEKLSLTTANADKLPYNDCRFDAVYCRLMLEYLSHPEASLAEMFRVCKPGGSFSFRI